VECRSNGYLVPAAIEIRKEKGKSGTVYTPYDPKELWQLAKDIICSLDSGAAPCFVKTAHYSMKTPVGHNEA
jgi:hypothetical protein